jgi:hypothetical protein
MRRGIKGVENHAGGAGLQVQSVHYFTGLAIE